MSFIGILALLQKFLQLGFRYTPQGSFTFPELVSLQNPVFQPAPDGALMHSEILRYFFLC